MSRNNNNVIVTPAAPTLWASLFQASVYDPNNPGAVPTPTTPGHFQVDLVFDPANKEQSDFLADLEAAAQEAVADMPGQKRDPLYSTRPDVDPETKEETGAIRVRFRISAGGVSRKTGQPWARTVPVFDASGTPMQLDGELANGSIVRASFEIVPYATAGIVGTSLRLRAIQALRVEYRQARNDAANDFAGLSVAADFTNTGGTSDGDF